MKKTTPIAGREVDAHCEATEATRKHAEPRAKSAAIHAVTAAACPAFRCPRDRHFASVPSGRRSVSLVTNGPGPSAETRSQPSGSST